MTTLLISSRHTVDNQLLWRAATARDWDVVRAHGLRVPEIIDSEVVIYIESLFAPSIAKSLQRVLSELPEDWLVRLPREMTHREIQLSTLGAARGLVQPTFVKPPNEKSFAAQVYASGQTLPLEFPDDMLVLLSEPVDWEVEFRCFCLDGKVMTLSPYLRNGALANESDYFCTEEEHSAVITFTENVLKQSRAFTPRAVVIDVGRIRQRGWAVVEANAAWGSGIYGCDPDIVLDVLRCATIQSVDTN